MLRGDISNETPPRIIVTVESVVEAEFVTERAPITRTKKEILKITGLKNAELSFLWNVSFKYGLAVELAGFADLGWTLDHLDSIMNKLERRGGNPFNYSELYDSLDEFIGELPYRTNLKGVVSTTPARFGSWGLDLANL